MRTARHAAHECPARCTPTHLGDIVVLAQVGQVVIELLDALTVALGSQLAQALLFQLAHALCMALLRVSAPVMRLIRL